MTDDCPKKSLVPVPFIFQFAQQMARVPSRSLRYDATRQISQVLINGRWVDGPDAFGEPMASTRLTKVRQETTDDE